MNDLDFDGLQINPSINNISEATSLDIYGQQISRIELLSIHEERTLGKQMGDEMSAIICGICNSAYGLDQLATVIEKYLQSYQGSDGSATKRWKYEVEPTYLGNLAITLIDTLSVMLFLHEDSKDQSNVKRNLITLLQNLSLGRQQLVEIAEQIIKDAPHLKAHLNRYYNHRAELIEKNLRLVYSVASRFKSSGVSYEDLIQEGNVGLLKAADLFNFNKGFRFSTYAFWCIQNVLKTALQKKYHTISRPSYLQEKLSIIKNVSSRYLNEYGKKPSIDELSTLTGIPIATLEKINSFPEQPVSLNQGIGSDEESSMLESLLPDGKDKTESLSEQRLKRRLLDRICRKLSDREYLVLKMRFGIDCRTEHTLEEISNQLNVSIERVRQLQKNALVKLQECDDSGF
ncbi:RNA polymerase sigma factor RpoD/SigA [Neptuniibacter sp.]|uniref:sigma-70 family RNA polymerase sigma factor n=1 Tax=Neptuniibacter sp. TaxID=1962643 RepID=UPI0026366B7B|nr:RNA polymerase sigma factor RpoD/SigA [Neptuniibacter sp.]MCP4596281.1 RNA polymerase sigma factor RpoD/SigA [Neptuniibacter sp.]